MNKRDIGKVNEDRAADYLIKKGYKVVAQNYRNRYGEVDIIAEDNNTTIFVEVKYRTGSIYGTGEESIDAKKCRKIAKVAQHYICAVNTGNSIRFDAVIFNDNEVSHIENFFWGDEVGL